MERIDTNSSLSNASSVLQDDATFAVRINEKSSDTLKVPSVLQEDASICTVHINEKESVTPKFPILTSWQQCLRLIPFILVSLFALANALNYANRRMPDPKTARPLPDIAFDILPKLNIEFATNGCVAILNILHFFIWYKLSLYYYGKPFAPFPQFVLRNPVGDFLLNPPQLQVHHELFKEMFIRFIGTYGSMLFLRCISVTVTVLPATDNHCQFPKPINNWWVNVLMTIVTVGGGSIHCGDLLFSGHMTVITASTISIVRYGKHISKIFPVFAVIVFFSSWFTILSSRSHYTDDIVVAFLLCALIYSVISLGGLRVPFDGRHESDKDKKIYGAPKWLLCILSPKYALKQMKQKHKLSL